MIDLLSAIQALGVMPEGYCYCRRDRVGDDRKQHEPECRDLRAAIAEAELHTNCIPKFGSTDSNSKQQAEKENKKPS